ncbi:MAG: type IV pilus modification PilV family protein [Planctomycetota bacterium]
MARRFGSRRHAGEGAPPRLGSRASAGGFSLLEVLVAMFVLSVGAASVLALFAAGASTHRRSVDRTNAVLVAERVFSEVRAAYRVGRSAGEVGEIVRKALPEEIGGYRYELELIEPEGDAFREGELVVRVTVRWRLAAAERSDSFFELILPRHGPGGRG